MLLGKLFESLRPQDAAILAGIIVVLGFLWRVIDRTLKDATLIASTGSTSATGPQITEILVQTKLMAQTLERVSETLEKSSDSFERSADTMRRFAEELARVNERMLRLEDEMQEVKAATQRASGRRDLPTQ
jgi:methyl-accepting chemotaxis protein